MRILITSDNHLGFKETDTKRSQDSFVTFAEILDHAKKNSVDIILQSGDLFHINNPTIYTMENTVKILKNYLLGEKKINLPCDKKLNFVDKKFNVEIPFLSIHGNHDDPSGLGRRSPMDIINSAGLVDYIGIHDNINNNVTIEPIIFEESKVAVFGIGYLNDARLFNAITQKKINFKLPKFKTFNILLLHQNRSSFYKNFISEDLFDDIFDLIVYGHEHDPVITKNRHGCTVLQCGSTIRTSLSEMECGDKYVYILDIDEKKLAGKFSENSNSINFNESTESENEINQNVKEIKNSLSRNGFYFDLTKIRLETVREFYVKTLNLEDIDSVDSLTRSIRENLDSILQQHKVLMKEQNGKKYEKIVAKFKTEKDSWNSKNFFLPLIRIRIETNINFSKSLFDNYIEFCSNSDILHFIKSKQKKIKFTETVQKREKNGRKFFDDDFANHFYESLEEKELSVLPPMYLVNEYFKKDNELEKMYDILISKYKKMSVFEIKEVNRIKNKLEEECKKAYFRKKYEVSSEYIESEIKSENII